MQQSALSDRGDISQEITDGFRLIFLLQKTLLRYLGFRLIFVSFGYIEIVHKSIKQRLKKPRPCLFA